MHTPSPTKTVVGVFGNIQDAQEAVRDLQMEAIPANDISLIANQHVTGYGTSSSNPTVSGHYTSDATLPVETNRETDPYQAKAADITHDPDKTASVVADAGIGAAIGGIGGLILSAVGALTIPVIGPIIAAGPIAAALAGAGIGAAAGGVIGALTEAGIPEEEAHQYAESIRRGDILVAVRTTEAAASRVVGLLENHHPLDVNDRMESWRQRGWSGFDANASPLTADELRKEQAYHGSEYERTEEQAHTDSREILDQKTIRSRGGARVYDYKST